jgi:hypothetical protein
VDYRAKNNKNIAIFDAEGQEYIYASIPAKHSPVIPQ